MIFNIDFLKQARYRNCPVCDKLYFKSFSLFIKNFILYEVVICYNCGTVYSNPIYNESHYRNLPCSYPKDYKEHSVRRAKYILNFCNSYLEWFDNINILDIGAGKGGVLMAINVQLKYKKEINSCIGITLENKISNVIKENIDIQKLDFENEDLKTDSKFDFIIMSHTLEHFINPVKVLNKISKLISKDGILYIEVPSFFNAKYRIKSVFTPEHLTYFTESSLYNLLINNGFMQLKFKESKIWGNIKVIYNFNPEQASFFKELLINDYVEKYDEVVKNYKYDRFNKWFCRNIKYRFMKYEPNE